VFWNKLAEETYNDSKTEEVAGGLRKSHNENCQGLFFLYGCETWSLTLREENRLRVFENRVLRGIFGPKRKEAREEWRKLHKEELYDLYSSPNTARVIKSRRMNWAGHVARMGERCKQGSGVKT